MIIPTETVYGLAARAADPAAVARLYEAKGRPRFNPLIAHVRGAAEARALARLDDRAERLMAAFWPGPLTVVAPYRMGPEVCDLARAGLETVALRAPAHPVARALIYEAGEALVAPSANRSGRPSPTTREAAVAETGESAAVSLDGGRCEIGLESTVVSLLEGGARLLRPGVRHARRDRGADRNARRGRGGCGTLSRPAGAALCTGRADAIERDRAA